MIDAREVANSLISQYSSKDYGMVRETAVNHKANCFLLHLWTNNAHLICMIRSIELYCCQLMALQPPSILWYMNYKHRAATIENIDNSLWVLELQGHLILPSSNKTSHSRIQNLSHKTSYHRLSTTCGEHIFILAKCACECNICTNRVDPLISECMADFFWLVATNWAATILHALHVAPLAGR
jgi:hypothetical protein